MAAAARMMQVQSDKVPPFHTCSTPPPRASSPDTLYALLLARGRSWVDMELQSSLQVGMPQPAAPREAASPADQRPDRHVTVYGEIIDLWIRALRSGRYHQLRGNWHYRHEVCAVEVILHELGYTDSGPREPLIEKIGYDLCSVVVALNDLQRWSFMQIADWLETRKPGGAVRGLARAAC